MDSQGGAAWFDKGVEKPIVPQKPSTPSKKLNIAIAGVLGLFVGVFVAFFKNYVETE